jgi:hypothetical protein
MTDKLKQSLGHLLAMEVDLVDTKDLTEALLDLLKDNPTAGTVARHSHEAAQRAYHRWRDLVDFMKEGA